MFQKQQKHFKVGIFPSPDFYHHFFLGGRFNHWILGCLQVAVVHKQIDLSVETVA